MAKKKNFFAQNNVCDAFNHRAKYFFTLEEAIIWLRENGGGTIKKRGAGSIFSFNEEVRVWKEVASV